MKVLRNQLNLLFSLFNKNNENFNDNNNKNIDFNNYCFALIISFAENVEFFNFNYENINNFILINVDKHIFYLNVYVFVNKLKKLIKNFIDEQCMRKLILKCFRDKILK